MFVPVVDHNQKPLMPTTPSRARRWIKSGKATGFFKKGVFCIRLNQEPSDRRTQPIAVGIDPGSKREGFTVKSKSHTYLNVQTHAVDWVKDHVEIRRNMRRARRFRKTPSRPNRKNRLVNKQRLVPSTKARWQWKLRICKWLTLMYPLTAFVVEDIKALTWKNGKKWNTSFSPLEVGKQWFYTELRAIAIIETRSGNDTYEMRQSLGLKKSKNKLSNKFDAHCVDSWVLANWYVKGHEQPDNINLIEIIPLEFHRRHEGLTRTKMRQPYTKLASDAADRSTNKGCLIFAGDMRQLHRLQHQAGHIRSRYGGTISAGFKRGSIVKHPKHGICYVGGWTVSPTKKDPERKTISLHNPKTGKRLAQNPIPDDCKFFAYNSWRIA